MRKRKRRLEDACIRSKTKCMFLLFGFKLHLNPRTQALSSDFIQTDVSKSNTSTTELKISPMLSQILKKIKVVFCKERKKCVCTSHGSEAVFSKQCCQSRTKGYLPF